MTPPLARLWAAVCGMAVAAAAGSLSTSPVARPVKAINVESVLRVTLDSNLQIAAAQHKYKSAEYSYKLFEADYSQLIPFSLNSSLQRYDNPASGADDRKVTGTVSVGMEKYFFDGSSALLSLGNQAEWTSALGQANTQYADGRLEIPLFSSYTKLSRTIQRTFEENQLQDANLAYVEAIKQYLRDAQNCYLVAVMRSQIKGVHSDFQHILKGLTDSAFVTSRPADRQVMFDEIKSLEATISSNAVAYQSDLINLQNAMGVHGIGQYTIAPLMIDVRKPYFYGKRYLDESLESIYGHALQNDANVKVLGSMLESAKEKKYLAEHGKWNFLASLQGRYNYAGFNSTPDLAQNYTVGAGLKIKKFDLSVLNYSRLSAEENIFNIQSRILEREMSIKASINVERGEAENRRKLLLDYYALRESRWEVYNAKLKAYAAGKETVENFLAAFRGALDAERQCVWTAFDYTANIRDLDYLCAVYFSRLHIPLKIN